MPELDSIASHIEYMNKKRDKSISNWDRFMKASPIGRWSDF